MNIKTILEHFQESKIIEEQTIREMQNSRELRVELVNHFRENKDRDFAITLLDTFISSRKNKNVGFSSENLMVACYILALHNHIEDSLKIWEAKNVDFDTYCGVDIQLVAFSGVEETIEFLKLQTTEAGKNALDYVVKCEECGDLVFIEAYLSQPWFI